MKRLSRWGIPLAVLLAATMAALVAPMHLLAEPGRRVESTGLEPLVDTHEFMEHVVEGNFATLKQALSQKPADVKAWRTVRDTSLLLGESGNLLLIRKPDEADASEWSKLAVVLRQTGNTLTKAAKAKDFDGSQKAYLSLVQACNNCHVKYCDGEPKIVP